MVMQDPLGLGNPVTASGIVSSGDLGTKPKISIGGTAAYGAGEGKNRIKVGGALLGQILVGTRTGVLDGMFGDVVVMDSFNSTGKLVADARNDNATIFAQTPDGTMTYVRGSVSGKVHTILFGGSA